jgi:ribosomal protein L40E
MRFLGDVVHFADRSSSNTAPYDSGATRQRQTYMAICRACDAPLKVGANYCVVCGAKQHRLLGLYNKFRAFQLAFAALACVAIAAAFSIGLGKPAVHEVRSTTAAVASNHLDLAAPGTYLEERADEQDQGDPVITPQASATRNVTERREHRRHTPKSTTTPAVVRSKLAKATLNAPVGKGAATVQQPLPLDASSNLLPALPAAASDDRAPAPPAPPASPDPTSVVTVPSQQPETGTNETVPPSSEMALIGSESPNVTHQGRTSSQAEAAVQGARTIDEIYRQRTARCGGGVIGLLCRGTMRLNVCNGQWTGNRVPGMTVCRVGLP